ncbi:DUF5131 family protein [Blastomonas fulva]|uniref:DUF5131 family protein n=1 Tax=Blastomonas fulva TaxID=1550728 RepID=UPI003F6F0853
MPSIAKQRAPKIWNPIAMVGSRSSPCPECRPSGLATARSAADSCSLCMSSGLIYPRWSGRHIELDHDALNIPYRWPKGQRIWVNRLSDLFNRSVHSPEIKHVFAVMNETPRHDYLVATKNAKRLELLSSHLMWAPHIWVGVRVETAEDYVRIDQLRNTSARIKFLALEPLLGDLGDLDLTGIDWVTLGGESGPNGRAVDPNWVRRIRDQCIEQGIPFHFSQWGRVVVSKHGRTLDGRMWDEFPVRDGGPLDA